jgi:hypothetical protein
LDGYNQRDPEPWYIKDKRPKTRNMALVEISGLPPAINTMTLARRNRSMMGDPTPPTGGPSITPGTLTNSGGGSTTSSGSGTSSADQAALQAKEAELNAAAPGTGSAVQQAIDTLPNGAIKDFLTSFLANPDKALMSLIFGRQYTSGDYKVGELYMRNILGMEKVQDWEQVPDSYIPQAWAFFSAVMGVRIRTFDDMDALTGTSASPPAVRAANYLQRNPPEVVDISMDAATRAAMILGDETVSKFNMWNHRDEKWTLSIFTSIPYIYPLPGPVELSNFSGVHPILGTTFANGYPTDYTGPRYTTQKSGILQTGVTVVPQGTVPGGTPGATNLASMLKANPLTFLLVGGGLLFGISQGGKKGSVKGPNKSNMGWYVGGALLLLFLLMKKSATASPPAPITTSPGGPSGGPATITPVSNGGGGTATPIVITPPSGGPGIVIQPPAGGPTVDYPAPINPTLLNNGPLVGPGQVQSNDPGYYLTGGSGTGGGGIINNDTLKPQYLAVDQQQFV